MRAGEQCTDIDVVRRAMDRQQRLERRRAPEIAAGLVCPDNAEIDRVPDPDGILGCQEIAERNKHPRIAFTLHDTQIDFFTEC